MALGPLLYLKLGAGYSGGYVATISLNDVNGLYLAPGGIDPETAEWEDFQDLKPQWFSVTLKTALKGTPLRTALKKLEDYAKLARLYSSNLAIAEPVWFYWQTQDEQEKRTPVLDMTYELDPDEGYGAFMHKEGTYVNLSILVPPYWESDTDQVAYIAGSHNDYSTVDPFAYYFNSEYGRWVTNPASVVPFLDNAGMSVRFDNQYYVKAFGTLPGRITSFALEKDTANLISKAWVGFRANNYSRGTQLHVVAAPPGFTGISYGADTSQVSVSTASAGVCARTTFATVTTLARRFYNKLTLIGDDNYQGKYMLFVRVKLNTATDLVRLQIRHGFETTSEALDVMPDIILDGSKMGGFHDFWQLYPVGLFNMPSTGYRGSIAGKTAKFTNYCFYGYAERISGAAQLDVDCFYFLPADMLLSIDNWPDNEEFAYWITTDDNSQVGVTAHSGGAYLQTVASAQFAFGDQFGLPISEVFDVAVLATKAYNVHTLDVGQPTGKPFVSMYLTWKARYSGVRVDDSRSVPLKIQVLDTVAVAEWQDVLHNRTRAINKSETVTVTESKNIVRT